jgi:hypothetical protein
MLVDLMQLVAQMIRQRPLVLVDLIPLVDRWAQQGPPMGAIQVA